MKNLFTKNYKWMMVAVCIVAVFTFASWDDWTEVESLTVNQPNIAEQEPALYEKYLESIRNYRHVSHKVVIAQFDNLDNQGGRRYHLTNLPDSIDIISLKQPEVLPDWMQKEMMTCRDRKGMKFVYEIDFATLSQEYKDLESASEVEQQTFADYATEYVNRHLALCEKEGYDGVIVRYVGLYTGYMTNDEKEDYIARQSIFLDIFINWYNEHTGKILIFRGTPHFIEDKYLAEGSLLLNSKYIIVETSAATAATDIDYLMANVMDKSGIPFDRFIVTASTYSLDAKDQTTGHFWDVKGNAVSAVSGCARWVVSFNNDYKKAGLYILETQNDYYHSEKVYPNIREAISIMNPPVIK